MTASWPGADRDIGVLFCVGWLASPAGGLHPWLAGAEHRLHTPTHDRLASLQAPTSAVGFRVCVHKWLVLVRLLLGEVPDRTEFTAPDMAGPLGPYFDLTQAVRSGDLTAFRCVGEGLGLGRAQIECAAEWMCHSNTPLSMFPPSPTPPPTHPPTHIPPIRPPPAPTLPQRGGICPRCRVPRRRGAPPDCAPAAQRHPRGAAPHLPRLLPHLPG